MPRAKRHYYIGFSALGETTTKRSFRGDLRHAVLRFDFRGPRGPLQYGATREEALRNFVPGTVDLVDLHEITREQYHEARGTKAMVSDRLPNPRRDDND
jgi:hypothetical protein